MISNNQISMINAVRILFYKESSDFFEKINFNQDEIF